MRFPVFLRHELGTVYQAPQLLGNREAYEAECARIDKRGMLAIEFQDTADTHGVYRKYGCFIIGDRLIPRHLYMSRNWLVKSADIVDAAFLKEELDYMDANPHAQRLLKVCRMANIGYGRIDYALLNGEPQIWEINTTPQLLFPPGHDLPERDPVQAHFARGLAAAFDAVDPPAV